MNKGMRIGAEQWSPRKSPAHIVATLVVLPLDKEALFVVSIDQLQKAQ
jgi:hypothetical protein